MLTIEELKIYSRCSTNELIDYVKSKQLTTTEMDLDCLSYTERMECLDKLRTLHQWLLFREEGCLEYLIAERKFSRDKSHNYLCDFSINYSEEWSEVLSNFNESIGNISKQKTKLTPVQRIIQVICDYFLISFILFILFTLGVSKALLLNPIEAFLNFLGF